MKCDDPNPPGKDNGQGSGSAGSPSDAASSSTTPTPVQHTQYRLVTSKNAICDLCNQRNRRTMQKCETCGLTTCSVCHAQGRYDGRHNLANMDLPWSRNTGSPASGGSGGRRRGGARAQSRSGLVRQDISEGVQAQNTAFSALPAPVAPAATAPTEIAADEGNEDEDAVLPPSTSTAVPAAPEVAARGDKEKGEGKMTDAPAVAPSAAPLPQTIHSRSTAAPRSEMTDASDHDELFRGLLQEWSNSPVIARVKREEGLLQALDMVEAAVTMIAMSRDVPFSTNNATWLRRIRQYYGTA